MQRETLFSWVQQNIPRKLFLEQHSFPEYLVAVTKSTSNKINHDPVGNVHMIERAQ